VKAKVESRKKDPVFRALFELCDELLTQLVEQGAEKFAESLAHSGDKIQLLQQEQYRHIAQQRAKGLFADSVLTSTLRSLISVYRGVSERQATPDGMAARMRTLLGSFDRLCREQNYESKSAQAATRHWG
jgi:hypothetical protein